RLGLAAAGRERVAGPGGLVLGRPFLPAGRGLGVAGFHALLGEGRRHLGPAAAAQRVLLASTGGLRIPIPGRPPRVAPTPPPPTGRRPSPPPGGRGFPPTAIPFRSGNGGGTSGVRLPPPRAGRAPPPTGGCGLPSAPTTAGGVPPKVTVTASPPPKITRRLSV